MVPKRFSNGSLSAVHHHPSPISVPSSQSLGAAYGQSSGEVKTDVSPARNTLEHALTEKNCSKFAWRLDISKIAEKQDWIFAEYLN